MKLNTKIEMMFEIDLCTALSYYCVDNIKTNTMLLNLGHGRIIKLQGNWEEVGK